MPLSRFKNFKNFIKLPINLKCSLLAIRKKHEYSKEETRHTNDSDTNDGRGMLNFSKHTRVVRQLSTLVNRSHKIVFDIDAINETDSERIVQRNYRNILDQDIQ